MGRWADRSWFMERKADSPLAQRMSEEMQKDPLTESACDWKQNGRITMVDSVWNKHEYRNGLVDQGGRWFSLRLAEWISYRTSTHTKQECNVTEHWIPQ